MQNKCFFMSLSLLLSAFAFAGPKAAATSLHDRTVVDFVNLRKLLKDDLAVGTYERGAAVIGKLGNVVGVWFDGPTAAKVYDSLIEASQGNGEEVTAHAFTLTTDGVLITGAAARYATEVGLGTPAKLLEGCPASDYTLVPLLKNTQEVADAILNYVEGSGHSVVALGKGIKDDSNALIRGILKANPKKVADALKGITVGVTWGASKTVLNAGSGAVNTVTGAVNTITGLVNKGTSRAIGRKIPAIPAIPKIK